MNEPKTIVLCADDFGLNQPVSQGILKLVRLDRLSAVSCMVNAADFTTSAKDLLDLKRKVQLGLHFNLTEGNFLSTPEIRCFSLNELLIKAHLGLIKPSFIVKEFKAQLNQFIQIMGCLPDFIDGHQHVHQFPRIRPVILELFDERLRPNGAYIRSTYPTLSLPKYQLKTKILAFAGGKKLHSQLIKLAIPHNSYFSGIYDFNPETNYRALFRQWLTLASTNTLIMCHPGEGEDPNSTKLRINSNIELRHCELAKQPRVRTPNSWVASQTRNDGKLDPIALARSKELNYFLSDDFVNDCQEHQIRLTTGPKS